MHACKKKKKKGKGEVDIEDILHTEGCANTERWTEGEVKRWGGERKVKIVREDEMEM